ncbi:MAG: FAD-binding oxidoreductase [Dehalococcoidales bacterium]|nr:FAD-binding oxidoreductase [Dehalococcoidales bacterium]
MALERDTYKALEDIVGPENISEEPALLDAYSLHCFTRVPTGKLFGIRSEAVILPGNTGEVQAIVRICNKYKIRFKALSTGWGSSSSPASEGMVQLDLRRMNRILEINEKAMYAVVEPYVISGQFQAELMKRKLNCNITGAGANTSALPLTGLMGIGHTAVSTSYGNRNVLGVEWVLPTGEILRLGSLGSGAGWFCGDGPGPSLRGVIRGDKTPNGGMGVFTGAATKVYHWPGPAAMQIKGASPGYMPELPDTFMVHYITFPSWEKITEAGYKIGESEIALLCEKFPAWLIAQNLAESGREGVRIFDEIRSQTVDKGTSLLVIIGADSQREFDYKEKVLKQIAAENGGEFFLIVEEPSIRKKLIWHQLRNTTTNRETFRLMTEQQVSFGCRDTFEFGIGVDKEAIRLKRKYVEKGLFLDDGVDNSWSLVFEHGHLGHGESLFLLDPKNPASRENMFAYQQETWQAALEKALGHHQTVRGDRGHDLFGPRTSNYHLWARKVKKAFDPNGASDSSSYITPED